MTTPVRPSEEATTSSHDTSDVLTRLPTSASQRKKARTPHYAVSELALASASERPVPWVFRVHLVQMVNAVSQAYRVNQVSPAEVVWTVSQVLLVPVVTTVAMV